MSYYVVVRPSPYVHHPHCTGEKSNKRWRALAGVLRWGGGGGAAGGEAGEECLGRWGLGMDHVGGEDEPYVTSRIETVCGSVVGWVFVCRV